MHELIQIRIGIERVRKWFLEGLFFIFQFQEEKL